ncbi:MAG: ATP-grasp domain-containing protein [Planctomycetota bacterium]
MHVFVYEWVTGGGLVEEAGRIPESLFREGEAMVQAVAADFAALDGTRVSVTRDVRLDPLPEVESVEVHSEAHHRQVLQDLAAAADYAVVIAPEFDGILTRMAAAVRETSTTLLGPSDALVRAASNKQRTAELLVDAGVPTPPAVLFPADGERLPDGFDYPGVLKPLDGAGSQHTLLVEGPGDEPPPYPWPRRLERYIPGTPASVACIAGPAGRCFLRTCLQDLSPDGRFTYRGGRVLADGPLHRRAAMLAERALDALPPAAGYVGVDLVLGEEPDGRGDCVIEVNPRFTTSYIGLRAATRDNLAAALVQASRGELPAPEFSDLEIAFTADGVATLAR